MKRYIMFLVAIHGKSEIYLYRRTGVRHVCETMYNSSFFLVSLYISADACNGCAECHLIFLKMWEKQVISIVSQKTEQDIAWLFFLVRIFHNI